LILASRRKRILVEAAFVLDKTIAGVDKVKVRGSGAVRHAFTIAAFNLIRMQDCLPQA
jgi:hypothetical protein